jgi:NTE family protein
MQWRPRKALESALGDLLPPLVDGGLLSNFPIDSLDRSDLKRPRWPTFGVTVVPNIPRINDRVVAALKLMRLGAPPLVFSIMTVAMDDYGHVFHLIKSKR